MSILKTSAILATVAALCFSTVGCSREEETTSLEMPVLEQQVAPVVPESSSGTTPPSLDKKQGEDKSVTSSVVSENQPQVPSSNPAIPEVVNSPAPTNQSSLQEKSQSTEAETSPKQDSSSNTATPSDHNS